MFIGHNIEPVAKEVAVQEPFVGRLDARQARRPRG